MSTPRAIGIDFGTSNTVASVLYTDGRVVALALDPKAKDARLFKSLLYFPNRKEGFFGADAIEQYFDRGMEGRFFQSVKRLLPNPDFSGTSLFGSHSSVEDLVARFLIDLRKRILAQIPELDTLPVFFGRPARYAQEAANEGLAVVRFKKAIDIAGFKNYQLVEEPLAAARAPSCKGAKARADEELVMIVDLGGGTSDFTLFNEKGGELSHTLAVHGIGVAGDALDSAFFKEKLNPKFGSEIKYQRPFSSNVLTLPLPLVKMLPKWHHHAFLREKATWNFILTLRKELVDPEQKPQLENLITLVEENLGYKLHERVETLKTQLSDAAEADFSFRSYPIEIELPVARKDYETWISEDVASIVKTALETCRIGKRDASEISRIQFTGGTSKVPYVRAQIMALFPQAKSDDHETFTAVAEGLARTPEFVK